MGVMKFYCSVVGPTLVAVLATCLYFASQIELPPGDVPNTAVVRGVVATCRTLLRVAEAIEWMGLQQWQQTMRMLEFNPPPGVSDEMVVRTDVFDGIPVRVYTPKNAAKSGGAGLFYIHGGGWTILTAEACDVLVWEMAEASGMVAVSVEYRLAPETPYPASFDDSLKAYKHFHSVAASLGIDGSRIVISGDSAGGNLAAAVSQKLRDESASLPKSSTQLPALQILIYPSLQMSHLLLPSFLDIDGGILRRKDMARFMLSYLGVPQNSTNMNAILTNSHLTQEFLASKKVDWLKPEGVVPSEFIGTDYSYKFPDAKSIGRDSELASILHPLLIDPYLAPLMAPDMKGLPRTLQIVSGWDVLRDDSYLYKRRLDEFSVPNELFLLQNGMHGIFQVPGGVQPQLVKRGLDRIKEAMKNV